MGIPLLGRVDVAGRTCRMKAALTLLFSALILSAAPQTELEPRVPVKLAQLEQLKRKDPQEVFNVRSTKTGDVVAQLAQVVLDTEGQRAKFAVLYLYDNVAQHRPLIVAPWEALTINTNHGELFIEAGLEKLRQIPIVKAGEIPDRAPANWGSEYYTLYGVQPRMGEPEPNAAGTASLIGGVVKGSGSSESRQAVARVDRGGRTFIWLGLALTIFAVAMVMRLFTRARR